MKKWIVLLIFVLVISLVFISCGSSGNNTTQITEENEATTENSVNNNINNSTSTEAEKAGDVLEVGKLIPDFNMATLAGESVNISDYRGKIVMLNFWATWCSYCDLEMPDLDTVDKEDDVVVLAVNVRESEKIVTKYIENGGYSMEVVLDESGELADTFFISSFPTTFFINEEGILLGSVSGMLEMEQMKQIIDDIRNDIIQ